MNSGVSEDILTGGTTEIETITFKIETINIHEELNSIK